MEKCLIIVESPSKVRLIEKYLGSNYKVIASNGHICNIESLKDINVKGDFATKYKIIDCLKETLAKPIKSGHFYFKQINPLFTLKK